MSEKTTAGDPIEPNSAEAQRANRPSSSSTQAGMSGPRGGAVNDMLNSVIQVVDVSTNLVVNSLSEAVNAGGDIGSASLERINDLKSQLLEELNKAQQRVV